MLTLILIWLTVNLIKLVIVRYWSFECFVLQEAHPLFLEPESESTNSGKVVSEASPRPDNVQLETITNPSTNVMPIGRDLKVICTDNAPINCSTELPTQNSNVEDISDDHQPVENSCKKSMIFLLLMSMIFLSLM
jgi:hypothetical protein